jgi:hypothetical protein
VLLRRGLDPPLLRVSLPLRRAPARGGEAAPPPASAPARFGPPAVRSTSAPAQFVPIAARWPLCPVVRAGRRRNCEEGERRRKREGAGGWDAARCGHPRNAAREGTSRKMKETMRWYSAVSFCKMQMRSPMKTPLESVSQSQPQIRWWCSSSTRQARPGHGRRRPHGPCISIRSSHINCKERRILNALQTRRLLSARFFLTKFQGNQNGPATSKPGTRRIYLSYSLLHSEML